MYSLNDFFKPFTKSKKIQTRSFGNRIKFAYREFNNNVARPAFSNEVEYDLTVSREIGYKGARLEVINSSNTDITYKVLQGF
jgi:hypothetical protein